MIEIMKPALVIAGFLHFALLTASFSVPRVLNWNDELKKLDPLSRQLVLVHGGFIVFMIVAFGLITILIADALLIGSVVGAALAGMIASFWLLRLGVQLFYFDARRHLTTPFLRAGYRALTLVFVYFCLVYFATFWINFRTIWGQ